MKKISTLLVILFLLVLNACGTNNFVQIHTAQSNNVQLIDDEFYFENDEAKIIYDLWNENGNSGFIIKNKTNDLIYIHKDKCFFILNEIAMDYYKNESNAFISSKTEGSHYLTGQTFLSTYETEGHTNIQTEKKIIIIPPKSIKKIQGFYISNYIFEIEDLVLYPQDIEEIDTMIFDSDNSPYKFSNKISYSVGKIDNEIKSIQNEFWVTEIINMPKNIFEIQKYNKFAHFDGYYYPYKEPNRYYIFYKYNKKNKIPIRSYTRIKKTKY